MCTCNFFVKMKKTGKKEMSEDILIPVKEKTKCGCLLLKQILLLVDCFKQ